MIKTRLEFPRLLNDLKLTGRGVEIGVYEGEFSEVLLNQWAGDKLYLVDVWREMSSYEDVSNQRGLFPAMQCLVKTFTRIYPFGEKAVMLRETSEKAAKLFPDLFFDFVYIDAAHDYANVKTDLAAWYPKVKLGGVFSGHDFLDMKAGTNPWGEFAVKTAVTEFAAKHKLEIGVTVEPFPTWICRKP